MSGHPSDVERRVLVVPPTTRDGQVTCDLLAKAGLAAFVCSDLGQLCGEIGVGAGAVLLTVEAIASDRIEELIGCIDEQPSWSDLPIVLLMQGAQEFAHPSTLLARLGNVTLLERPAPTRSVVSALQTAVRGRLRQYQIRDHIVASVEAESRARRLQEQLAVVLEGERAARAEAERVSQMKDEFLATLSHELRTPLNAIFGWTQILQLGDESPETIREAIEIIDRNVRLQTQLIEDLLDMSRIISGKVRLDVQAVDLPGLINAAVEGVKPALDAKQLRLERVIDPVAGQIVGDPSRLQQVLWNLLTNAIKFTPPEGRIRVALEQVGSHVEVSVADSGEGISREFLPHLFERFSQADASMKRKHGGLGLGLSIVKNLVELHGGAIRATSDGEGRGATFTIQLPTGHREVMEPALHLPRTNITPLAVDRREQLSGVKVLVVDDEPDARRLVQRFLTACGATAALAGSAAEAHSLLLTFEPDVIISDIGMPAQDGYEFIRAVRSNGQRAPAVALTAFVRADDRLRSIQAGYQMHLPKPVEPAELLAVVASLAGRL